MLSLRTFIRTALAAMVFTTAGWADNEYGLGNLVPGRYLNTVRQGTEDKLPSVTDTPVYRAGGVGAQNSNATAYPQTGSVPAAVPAATPEVSASTSQNTVSQAAGGNAANLSFAGYQSAMSEPASAGSVPKKWAVEQVAQQAFQQGFEQGSRGPASVSVPNGAVPNGAGVAGVAAPVQAGFMAGSLGDVRKDESRGVTGLGAGWGTHGNREDQDLARDFGADEYNRLMGSGVAPSPATGGETPARAGAANRLLAAVQQNEDGSTSAREAAQQLAQQQAQQLDMNMRSDSYRALTSVLAFQELPRGAGGADPKPKALWANPDPKQIKSSSEVLNTLHSKAPIGEAEAAYRKTASGRVESSVPGAVASARGGDAGGIGQTGGIYQPGSSTGGGSAAAPTAVPFQFSFPLPGMNNAAADAPNY